VGNWSSISLGKGIVQDIDKKLHPSERIDPNWPRGKKSLGNSFLGTHLGRPVSCKGVAGGRNDQRGGDWPRDVVRVANTNVLEWGKD